MMLTRWHFFSACGISFTVLSTMLIIADNLLLASIGLIMAGILHGFVAHKASKSDEWEG